MITIYKAREIEKYVSDFAQSRVEELDVFFRSTHRDRETGIYKLKGGAKLMDFLITLHSEIVEKMSQSHLIPQVFASPEQLLVYLLNFRTYVVDKQKLISIDEERENISYIVTELREISEAVIAMIDYVKQWYDADDTGIPYLEMRYCLMNRNVDRFVEYLKTIFASVSYAINKSSEGAYHSNLHVIMKLLGFDIISEDLTNVGRIDAVVRLSDVMYILEIKVSDSSDESDTAIRQIVEKKYPQKYMCQGYDIVIVGLSFSTTERNINGYKWSVWQ